MYLVQQTIWSWPIILYLFLGGLGGAGTAIVLYFDAFVRRIKKFALYTVLLYWIGVIIGMLLLIYDMLQPTKFYLVFSFANPSWITYGSVFLALYTILTFLYLVPLAREWSWVNTLLSKLKLNGLADKLEANKGLAAITIFVGIVVAAYTGFLISVTPAIPFWNNSIMPVLFLVSGASTGIGLGLVLFKLAKDHDFAIYLEKMDIGLIIAELLMLFALFNTSLSGQEAATYSATLLLGNVGFIVGVIIIGLLLPLLLETYTLFKHMKEKEEVNPIGAMVIAGILILIGGLLLRYYILWAGVFSYPWPPH